MRPLDPLFLPYPRRFDRPAVIGHRGASGKAPENTLESFAEAQRQGADGVELDAMCCSDGTVVVCHDEWLDRLAGAHVEIRATPYRQLRTLDVSRHFPSWGQAARIPTLDEVLSLTPHLQINIELKDERLNDGGLAHRVAEIVRAHRAEHRVVISSFNPLELVRMRRYAPRLPLAFLFEPGHHPVLSWGLAAPVVAAQAVHPAQTLCTPARIKAWHACGFAVATWTVNDPVNAVRLAKAGVDAIITNYPALILSALEQHPVSPTSSGRTSQRTTLPAGSSASARSRHPG